MIFVSVAAFGFGFLVGVVLTADYIEKECGCEHAKD